jgi:hypothetical protein
MRPITLAAAHRVPFAASAAELPWAAGSKLSEQTSQDMALRHGRYDRPPPNKSSGGRAIQHSSLKIRLIARFWPLLKTLSISVVGFKRKLRRLSTVGAKTLTKSKTEAADDGGLAFL